MSYQKVPPPQDGYPPPGNSPLPSSPGSIPPRVRLVWLLAGPGRSDGGGRGFLDLNLTLFRIPILFWVDLDACPKSESGTAQHRGTRSHTRRHRPAGSTHLRSTTRRRTSLLRGTRATSARGSSRLTTTLPRMIPTITMVTTTTTRTITTTVTTTMATTTMTAALASSEDGWPFFAAAACWRNVAAAAADGLNALKLLHLEDRPAAPLPENPTPTSPPPPPAPPPAAAAAAASISGSPPPLPLPPPPRVGQFLLAVDELPPDRGTKPLQIWDKEVVDGHIKRPQDEDIQSNVLEIIGTNVQSTYITCPADPAATLGIKLPFLALIVKNLKKYFTFEIQVLDDKNVRRRFRASNFQSVTRVKPYICTMPLKLEDGWNNIQLNLSDLTKRAYGTNYVETLRVQVHANCRLRRIYFADRLYSEEELPPEFKLYLPIQKA
uniref:CFA20 domain-containing protein n=1 Tax=Oryza meridionalis TaxID=40149 RepID=A0A0E0ETQ1_9ORYZ